MTGDGDGDAAEVVCVGKRLCCLCALRIPLYVLRKEIHLHTYSRDGIGTRKILFDREGFGFCGVGQNRLYILGCSSGKQKSIRII